jgi:hypothetical protein
MRIQLNNGCTIPESHEPGVYRMDSVTLVRIFAGILFLCMIYFYFLPSIIGRKKRDRLAIFALNLLAGWSLVGWIIALVWALKEDQAPVVAFQPTIVAQPLQPLLCSNCGKYSQPGGKFCPNCGQSF